MIQFEKSKFANQIIRASDQDRRDGRTAGSWGVAGDILWSSDCVVSSLLLAAIPVWLCLWPSYRSGRKMQCHRSVTSEQQQCKVPIMERLMSWRHEILELFSFPATGRHQAHGRQSDRQRGEGEERKEEKSRQRKKKGQKAARAVTLHERGEFIKQTMSIAGLGGRK